MRHDEKITVYISKEELLALETARLTLRGHGLAVDRGRIVLDQNVDRLKAGYFRRKVVSVKFTSPREFAPMDGVSTKADGAALELVVDTATRPIGDVIGAVSGLGGVADLTVSDPPMEEIIADIFRAKEGCA